MMTPAEYQAHRVPKKPTKYRSRQTEVDGIRFDSKAEADYYGQLRLRAAAGEIQGFDVQVPFPIIVEGVVVCTYVADFVLYHLDGSQECQDVKGARSGPAYKLFRLKAKLLEATRGIKITIITSKSPARNQ
ncbi:DUF1064 domain-containing protein [Larkinella soli]|uniref:DUF1064 domain-containing protein n=1 Tax=Larkinella soli TaxID=1770527 RepID=UPI0013E2E7DF|nr:DUF1064 domain-containing protein [Larkinella soli]